MNVITGLPRAGSTLLCNILNQNPRFHATTTSILSQMLSQISHLWSTSPEFKSMLSLHREEVDERTVRTLRAIAKAWHNTDKVVFDKSRGWSSNALVFNQLFPEGKMICLVRDLRNVFASIEKQHRKNPILDESQTPQAKTIFSRADNMFSPQGIIGAPLTGIEDLLRRTPKGVILIKYEELADNPKKTMQKLYVDLEQDHFEHDFNDVKNTAEDPDFMYLNKYPHKGEGKVNACDIDEWKKYLTTELSMTIMDRFKGYNKAFNYGGGNEDRVN